MENKPKVIVVHPDKQHSFMTAKAIKDMGVLDKYITTVYDKNASFTHILASLLKGNFRKKLKAHKSGLLEDSDVKQYAELTSLFLFILVRIDKTKRIYTMVKKMRDKAFNKKVVRYCRKNNIDAVISFDTLSAEIFTDIDKLGLKTKKIIDMSAPYFPYMSDIFAREAEAAGEKSKLYDELASELYEHWKAQSKQEIRLADAFLVASDFTKKSLVESGADSDKIYKCLYGMNTGFFNADERTQKEGNGLNCIYVGNITEQKGCRYLFEVIKKTQNTDIKFTLVGAYDAENPMMKECREICEFTGYILAPELKKRLSESDVMIFPSLADGFGFAVLEAMACGVVPICSHNAGVSSVIDEGVSGFCIDAQSWEQALEKLMYLDENRDVLKTMSENAAAKAKSMTWESYYKDVQNAVRDIIK
ncbi:MAG: glycosyltransferase family 4 protein [Clostridia bacterium]|nr:glycosyltransferase family 4 protein [Clostridia bacterium]